MVIVSTTNPPNISIVVYEILSNLGIYPHDFAFGIIPKGLVVTKKIVLTYILKTILLSNQCGTLVPFTVILPYNCVIIEWVQGSTVNFICPTSSPSSCILSSLSGFPVYDEPPHH
ncbi:hypothetical protein Csa_019862 [Cucumis sativus]|uniref:Uncharacterized protein n=1 Tax=Cucumis sativus TaxID=3659 RepID=A0A0A0LZ25_CUCSA|nr:hypothetical protein Csa_019862 [Cucumis sativus]